MQAWFVSDIHIKHLNERNGNILLRFLNSIVKRDRPATHLFFLGDIFDFWVGDHEYYRKKFRPFIDEILKLKKLGIEIHYFEGNHDVHVKSFWENHMSVPCWTAEKYFHLGSRLVRCEHGDFINPNDLTYIKYRNFIRRPFMTQVAQLIPAAPFNIIGDYASRNSRKKSQPSRLSHETELRKMIQSYAQKACLDAPFDLIITGHMHIDDDFTFEQNGKTCRSINLGSWFDHPKTLCISDGTIEMVSLS